MAPNKAAKEKEGGMDELFNPIKAHISFDNTTIDNAVFRLNTKFTVFAILCASLIVTAQQFIGDPIDCVVREIPASVMDTYCWIHSTFTLTQEGEYEYTGEGVTAAPNVGPDANPDDEEATTNQKYYQWVAFTLFFQAGLFYLPRTIWKRLEGGKMERVVPKAFLYAVTDSRMPLFPMPMGVLSVEKVEEQLEELKKNFDRTDAAVGNAKAHRMYFLRFMFCEFLTAVNVVGQIFFTDFFLGGMFTQYGVEVFKMTGMDPEDRTDPMSMIFPKMAKCTFARQGPTGTVEYFDGLCVLPINIINEKIYIFLWYWLVILAIITGVFLLYRLAQLVFCPLRKQLLIKQSSGLVHKDVADRVSRKLTVGEWFFLYMLGANLEPKIYSELMTKIDLMQLRSVGRVNHGAAEVATLDLETPPNGAEKSKQA